MENKALFLDRDGVINIDKGYVYKICDLEFTDGIFQFIDFFFMSGYKIIIITNQSGIGRGIFSEDSYRRLMNHIYECFKKKGIDITNTYFCPHHPKHGIGKYLKDCNFRKPKTGMITQAVNEFNLDINKCLLVGDNISDIQAGIISDILFNYQIIFKPKNSIVLNKKWNDRDYFIASSFKNIQSHFLKYQSTHD